MEVQTKQELVASFGDSADFEAVLAGGSYEQTLAYALVVLHNFESRYFANNTHIKPVMQRLLGWTHDITRIEEVWRNVMLPYEVYREGFSLSLLEAFLLKPSLRIHADNLNAPQLRAYQAVFQALVSKLDPTPAYSQSELDFTKAASFDDLRPGGGTPSGFVAMSKAKPNLQTFLTEYNRLTAMRNTQLGVVNPGFSSPANAFELKASMVYDHLPEVQQQLLAIYRVFAHRGAYISRTLAKNLLQITGVAFREADDSLLSRGMIHRPTSFHCSNTQVKFLSNSLAEDIRIVESLEAEYVETVEDQGDKLLLMYALQAMGIANGPVVCTKKELLQRSFGGFYDIKRGDIITLLAYFLAREGTLEPYDGRALVLKDLDYAFDESFDEVPLAYRPHLAEVFVHTGTETSWYNEAPEDRPDAEEDASLIELISEIEEEDPEPTEALVELFQPTSQVPGFVDSDGLSNQVVVLLTLSDQALAPLVKDTSERGEMLFTVQPDGTRVLTFTLKP